MTKTEAMMDGMQKAFFDKYSISEGQRIHFENTGKFQDKRLNNEYDGFWSGWASKANQETVSRDEEIKKLRDVLKKVNGTIRKAQNAERSIYAIAHLLAGQKIISEALKEGE